MEKIVESCKYYIANYEFGPHDKGGACKRGKDSKPYLPYSCDRLCKNYAPKEK